MKDIAGFSKWMEETLDEAINKVGCEACAICFVLPQGGTMSAFYGADYADKKLMASALQEDVMDHYIRVNMPMWLERAEQDREEPEEEDEEEEDE